MHRRLRDLLLSLVTLLLRTHTSKVAFISFMPAPSRFMALVICLYDF